MFDVISIGNSSYDIFLSDFDSSNKSFIESDKFDKVEVGSKIEFNKLKICPGGGASNTAVSLAKQGFEVGIISRIGQDFFGKRILKNYYKAGVDTKYIQVDKKVKNPTSIIILNENGEKTILIYRGSEKHISEKLIDFHNISTKWFYITSLAGNFKILESIYSHALNNNIKIAFNPGFSEIKNSSVLKYLNNSDLVFLNLDETKKLFGTDETNSVLHKAKSVLKDTFIINDGEEGTYLITKDKIYHSDIISVNVEDLTGAGDAFGAGYLSGLLKSGDKMTALKYGAYNAAQVVQRVGAQSNLPKNIPDNIKLSIKEINI